MRPAALINSNTCMSGQPAPSQCASPAYAAGWGGCVFSELRALPKPFRQSGASHGAHVVCEAFQTSQTVVAVPYVGPKLPGLGRVSDRLFDRSFHVQPASVRQPSVANRRVQT